ncbi:MAG TPA: hypothetical protein VMV89_00895 [Candidatus Paceibacterota bacterium]|nr:hypothetical protein [Candidatus Paceibacterota bacterium]
MDYLARRDKHRSENNDPAVELAKLNLLQPAKKITLFFWSGGVAKW